MSSDYMTEIETFKPNSEGVDVGLKLVKLDLSAKFKLDNVKLVTVRKGKYGYQGEFIYEGKIFFLGQKGILFSILKAINADNFEPFVGKKLNIVGSLINYGKRVKNGITFTDIRFYPNPISTTTP